MKRLIALAAVSLAIAACGSSSSTTNAAEAVFQTSSYKQTLTHDFAPGVREQVQSATCQPARNGRSACVVTISDNAPKHHSGALWHFHYTVTCHSGGCSITHAGAQQRLYAGSGASTAPSSAPDQ